MVKKCKICGAEFTTKYKSKEYCSEVCRRGTHNESNRQFRQRAEQKGEKKVYKVNQHKYDARKAAEESSRRIRELERAAAAAGMSYGKYVSKYGL